MPMSKDFKNLQYSDLSINLTKKLSLQVKKNNGIYFTPRKTVLANLDFLKTLGNSFSEILEPSCGSGEYLSEVANYFPEANITGIEKVEEIYQDVKKLSKSNIKIFKDDFLLYQASKKYDLIIGNPPYFVIKKDKVNKEYFAYFEGRPNIFIFFIIKSLNLLNKDGILSFVLPKNFLTCLYYDKTRKFIYDNFKILTILECIDSYIETKQETIILIVQNSKNLEANKKYTLEKNLLDYRILATPKNIEILEKLYLNSTSLEKLNFKTVVGNVVWNQVKNILTDDKEKTPLIYSSDISQNIYRIKKYKDSSKKNYIDKKGFKEPVLLINRGYGVGKYNFNYCLLKGDFEYLIENHLIMIKYKKEISNLELISLYEKIINSFNNEKTKTFIQTYFSNNAINTSELLKVLPIYDI